MLGGAPPHRATPPGLEHLVLHHNQIGSLGAHALAGAVTYLPSASKLQSIDLSHNPVGEEAAAELREVCTARGIKLKIGSE